MSTLEQQIKKCIKCDQPKPLVEFPVDKGSTNNRRNTCKICYSKQLREYYAKNKAKRRKEFKEYYQENKEYFKEYGKEYSLNNRKKINAKNKARYHKEVRGVCSFCDKTENLEFHHPDYAQPLFVVTVCRSCHKRLHAIEDRKIKQREREAVEGFVKWTLETYDNADVYVDEEIDRYLKEREQEDE